MDTDNREMVVDAASRLRQWDNGGPVDDLGYTPADDIRSLIGWFEASQLSGVVGEGWQPIETAPRVHGQMILSFNRNGAMDIICWNDSANWWDDGDYRDNAPEYEEPQFWMPLPEPPSAALNNTGGQSDG